MQNNVNEDVVKMGKAEQQIMLEQELRKLNGKSSVAVLFILGIFGLFLFIVPGVILLICSIAQAINISSQKREIKNQIIDLNR